MRGSHDLPVESSYCAYKKIWRFQPCRPALLIQRERFAFGSLFSLFIDPWGKHNTSQFCSKSLNPNQSTGGEDGTGEHIGEEMSDEASSHALSLSAPATRFKKTSRGNPVVSELSPQCGDLAVHVTSTQTWTHVPITLISSAVHIPSPKALFPAKKRSFLSCPPCFLTLDCPFQTLACLLKPLWTCLPVVTVCVCGWTLSLKSMSQITLRSLLWAFGTEWEERVMGLTARGQNSAHCCKQ